MTNCLVTIEISEYLPDNLTFDSFGFIFRSEAKDFEEEITFTDKNALIHATPIKKDIKYTIKITKNGSLIGIADFSIPHAVLSKKEESYSKQCPVTMTDSMKRIVLGSVAIGNTIKITVNAKLQYGVQLSNLKQSHSLPKKEMKPMPMSPKPAYKQKQQSEIIPKEQIRETKTPPMNTLKRPSGNNKGPTPNTKKSPITNYKTSPLTKQDTTKQETNQQPNPELIEKRELPPDADPNDTSVIDPIIQEQIIQMDKQFNDLIVRCTDEFNISDISSLTDLNELQSKTKESIAKIFKLQEDYYQRMYRSINQNKRLKELLLKYNEKYRTIIKKHNRLKEQLESNEFRKEIATSIRPEECERTKDIVPLLKQEFKLYQNVFNKFSLDAEVQNFKETNNKTKEESLLVLAMKNVIDSYGNLSKITPNAKLSTLQNIIMKYSLPNPEQAASPLLGNDNIPDQKQIIPIPENKINEENEEEENEHLEEHEQEEHKEMEHVISSSPDQIDINLNKYLTYFYSKRKVARIPFIKSTANNYEYGTQKVMIKAEGDTFRVRNIGGYNLLDKFIESNVAIEESKMKNKKNTKSPSSSIPASAQTKSKQHSALIKK